MGTRLFRKTGYFATAAAWLGRTKGKPATLHEDRECAALRCWPSLRISVSLADARTAEKMERARLCKRCGSMK